jgi:hypothetical protein
MRRRSVNYQIEGCESRRRADTSRDRRSRSRDVVAQPAAALGGHSRDARLPTGDRQDVQRTHPGVAPLMSYVPELGPRVEQRTMPIESPQLSRAICL